MSDRRPDWLVIGAQKSATTWLYKCLHSHPELFLPDHKREFEYLAAEKYREEGAAEFWRHFEPARASQTVVHVSVDYMFDPHAPGIVGTELPAAGLIASLRNPIERALSAHGWMVRKGILPNETPEQALRKALDRLGKESSEHTALIERGFYDDQLERFRSALPDAPFLILFYEQIDRHPEAVLRAVYERLGVDPSFTPASIRSRPKVNVAFGPTLLLERLFPREASRKAGIVTRGVSRLAQGLNEIVFRHVGRPEREVLSPSLRDDLRAVFQPHNQRLDRLIERMETVPVAPEIRAARDWS
jgi:hypothetical protein